MAQIILDSNNNLIQGDFDNATLNNRTKLQTTTTNATTNVYVVPNGSSTSAGVSVANNSSLTNASKIVMATNGTTDTQIISGVNGSGTYLPLSFYTNNALAMQVDTGGNVLVNDTAQSGSAKLTLKQSVNATNGGLAFVATDGNGAVISRLTDGGFTFRNGGAERMRIDSSGNVLIGTTTTNAKVTIKGSTTNFTGGLQLVRSDADRRWELLVGGDDKLYLGFGNATTPSTVGYFATNGAYTAVSDLRKKKDIEYKFDGLSLVNKLQPAMGRMLDDSENSELRPFFIAQNVISVLPSLVSSTDPDTSVENPILGVDYASMTPILVKAIQEQQELIKQLQADVASLKGA